VAEGVAEVSAVIGEREACRHFGMHRGSFQRRARSSQQIECIVPIEACAAGERTPAAKANDMPSRQVRRHLARQAVKANRTSPRSLTDAERQSLLDAVHQTRFVDRSVPYIYATLLAENQYHASISTIYRVLRRVGEVGERRDQAIRPAHAKPELCATGPNQVWAWDITKLHGPQKWTYFYLYAIVDIYSRYVVGWMVADRESSELARHLLKATIEEQGIDPTQLTIHSDRGSSMTSKPVAFLLADLGVTKSHSRPHVSNDNPHAESLFKTVKYQPEFPNTFPNLVAARQFCRTFFAWYNSEHRHSGIALLTPADVHYGRADEQTAARQATLDAAYAAHPERFVRGRPRPLQLQAASYINRPIEPPAPTSIQTAA
jgi:putative transposase